VRSPAAVAALALLLVTAGGARAQVLPDVEVHGQGRLAVPLPAIDTGLGAGVIAPPGWGDRTLRQCSRATLGPGESYWTATLDDVRRADRAIAGYFAAHRPPRALERWPALSDLDRQYLGVVRHGHRTVYVSYLPAAPPGNDEWRRHPPDICDGGPAYFGAEIDLESLRVIQIAFDGCACTLESSGEPPGPE